MTSAAQIFSTAFNDFLTTWRVVRRKSYSFGPGDIARATGMPRAKVYRHLKRLEAMGLLEVTQLADRTENIFRVIK